MVGLFDAVGMGQWLRYVTGVIELVSGLSLLVPFAAPFGALLLIPTMLGAMATNLFIVNASPVMPLLLMLGAAFILWGRRHQLRTI